LSARISTVTVMSSWKPDSGTLAERTMASRPRLPRHVLVRRDGVWLPGLLLEWIPSGAGWQGRAVWAHGTPVEVTIGVVDSADLQPFDSRE